MPDEKIVTNQDVDIVSNASTDATLKNDHEETHLMTVSMKSVSLKSMSYTQYLVRLI